MWSACKVGKGSFHMVRAADMARSNQTRIASYILFQANDEEEIGENSDQESVNESQNLLNTYSMIKRTQS